MKEAKDATIVIGGGLAGLAAATILAEAGRPVTLLERTQHLGGRGQTERRDGYRHNLGPHALYGGGPAVRILGRLKVPYSAPKVRQDRSWLLREDQLLPLPSSPLSLLGHRALRPGEKWALMKCLAWIERSRPEAHADETIEAWLSAHLPRALHPWLLTLFRVATYTDWPQRQSAELGLLQLKRVLRYGVHYVDGGWQSLADGLRQRAQAAGVEVLVDTPARQIHHDRRVRAVALDDGRMLPADAVVLACGPQVVARLVGTPKARALSEGRVEVQAATLDVALSAWPRPEVKTVFGLDAPTYFAVHSATARLAPEGGVQLHVARYLRPGDGSTAVERATLEADLERLQPGWRGHLVFARFLPKLVVSHAAVLADQGGLRARPRVDALGIDGLTLAGDWVGPTGALLDAALASAEAAAQHLLSVGSEVRAA